MDVALWDLAARDEDLSIADMLGRRRDRIRGCASAPPVETPEDGEAMVDELLDDGFRAIKLHVCGDLETDIAVCRAARRAAGDDVDLMMDAMAVYDRHSARSLGFVLDDLDFRWYEDPLSDEDLEGWRELRRLLETPIAGADSVRFTARDYGRPAATGAFDIVRMDAARNGITELRALADLAASLGLRCEGHSFGSALGQAANLQVALSVSNGDFFELPVPVGGTRHRRAGRHRARRGRIRRSPRKDPGSGSSSTRTPSPSGASTSAEGRHGGETERGRRRRSADKSVRECSGTQPEGERRRDEQRRGGGERRHLEAVADAVRVAGEGGADHLAEAERSRHQREEAGRIAGAQPLRR